MQPAATKSAASADGANRSRSRRGRAQARPVPTRCNRDIRRVAYADRTGRHTPRRTPAAGDPGEPRAEPSCPHRRGRRAPPVRRERRADRYRGAPASRGAEPRGREGGSWLRWPAPGCAAGRRGPVATGKWKNGYAGTWRVGTNGRNETCGRGLAAGTHDWERGDRAGTPWLGDVIGSDPWRTATRREPEIGSHDRDRLFRQQGADGVEGQERDGDGRYARLRVPVGERIHHAIVIR